MQGMTLWFTGLSAAGKTTLSRAVHSALLALGHQCILLDSDFIRHDISPGLGFSKTDRDEHIRRLASVAADHNRKGVISLVAAVSPYREARDLARLEIGQFYEIYVDAPLEVCVQRDPTGLYARYTKGVVHGIAGLDDPYEPPLSPELHCRTDLDSVTICVEKIVAFVNIEYLGSMSLESSDIGGSRPPAPIDGL